MKRPHTTGGLGKLGLRALGISLSCCRAFRFVAVRFRDDSSCKEFGRCLETVLAARRNERRPRFPSPLLRLDIRSQLPQLNSGSCGVLLPADQMACSSCRFAKRAVLSVCWRADESCDGDVQVGHRGSWCCWHYSSCSLLVGGDPFRRLSGWRGVCCKTMPGPTASWRVICPSRLSPPPHRT